VYIQVWTSVFSHSPCLSTFRANTNPLSLNFKLPELSIPVIRWKFGTLNCNRQIFAGLDYTMCQLSNIGGRKERKTTMGNIMFSFFLFVCTLKVIDKSLKGGLFAKWSSSINDCLNCMGGMKRRRISGGRECRKASVFSGRMILFFYMWKKDIVMRI
jgi:hypothetical protein